MGEWTPEDHAAARVWANDRGAKSRSMARALDEIEALQAERDDLRKACEAFNRAYVADGFLDSLNHTKRMSDSFDIAKAALEPREESGG